MYVCMHACMYVCMYICMYVSTYVGSLKGAVKVKHLFYLFIYFAKKITGRESLIYI